MNKWINEWIGRILFCSALDGFEIWWIKAYLIYEWYYLTSIFVTIFCQNQFRNPNRLKIPIRGDIDKKFVTKKPVKWNHSYLKVCSKNYEINEHEYSVNFSMLRCYYFKVQYCLFILLNRGLSWYAKEWYFIMNNRLHKTMTNIPSVTRLKDLCFINWIFVFIIDFSKSSVSS